MIMRRMLMRGFTTVRDLGGADIGLQQAVEDGTILGPRLVICDEINNAVHGRLLTKTQLKKLITSRAPNTSLCLTGRDFPKGLIDRADIATNMTKLKHHFDDKFLANKGIDF